MAQPEMPPSEADRVESCLLFLHGGLTNDDPSQEPLEMWDKMNLEPHFCDPPLNGEHVLGQALRYQRSADLHAAQKDVAPLHFGFFGLHVSRASLKGSTPRRGGGI